MSEIRELELARRQVPCPSCGAEPGDPCRDFQGNEFPRHDKATGRESNWVHALRAIAYEEKS
jgi:hypothetical protein